MGGLVLYSEYFWLYVCVYACMYVIPGGSASAPCARAMSFGCQSIKFYGTARRGRRRREACAALARMVLDRYVRGYM